VTGLSFQRETVMYDTPEELIREIEAGEDSFLDWKEVTFQEP
jgi:hypothetical protein